MDVIPDIRRLHFVENVTITDLAKPFKLSRPANISRISSSAPISSN
jgi:hypothetical protein